MAQTPTKRQQIKECERKMDYWLRRQEQRGSYSNFRFWQLKWAKLTGTKLGIHPALGR